MADITQKAYNAIATAMSTELNSLGAGSSAISSALGSDAGDAALLGDWELTVTYGSAPAATAVVDLWLVRSIDGTNYTDGSGSVVPPSTSFVGSFPLRAVNTIQRIPLNDVPHPPGLYKTVLRNGAAVAFPSSGTTLKVRTHSAKSA